jgi:CelD/BcsL family acetyltransferase involved in cellulose biosynthesis
MLTTHLITARADLDALEMPWNILAAGEPMRSWNWLATWWKYYGKSDDRELHILAVYEESESGAGTLVGIAPWYIEHTPLHGRVLRPLGDGHVCTDHLSLVCRPDYIATVATTIADYLTVNDDDWDRLELGSIDDGDDAITLLVGELESRDALVSCQRGSNCWVIDLPATWDEYTASLSSSHRRHLRKCDEKYILSGRSRLHVVTNAQELDEAWTIFVDLHQRRRKNLGDEGCFASPEFHDFHRDVAGQLLELGQLRMSWIELDGTPFTAEYHFCSPETVYTYQSGMDTDRLSEAPGRLAYVLTLRRAIEDGFTHLDFLRGDEPYKAHFRAVAKPTLDYHVFPNRRLARLRGQVLLAAGTLKHWVKQGVASVKG